jgi:hypothetical protein
MPASAKAPFWYILSGSDHPETDRGEIPLECDFIPESKISRLPVIFTSVSLTTKFVELRHDKDLRQVVRDE